MALTHEQPYLEMSSSDQLHLPSDNLSIDTHQQTSAGQEKYIINAVSPVMSPTAIDGQHQKLDKADLSKRNFIDKQIKKVKSLSGLMKNTALSRQTPLQPTLCTDPIVFNSPSSVVINSSEDVSSTHHHQEPTNETRRPRVSFSDFHKIQYFEDNTPHYRHRYRSARKASALVGNTHLSSLVTQHSQIPHPSYRPLSRQQLTEHESVIIQQPAMPSPRPYSSRMTHLPDLPNQPVPAGSLIREKYVLQREKPLLGIPEPAADIPINSSTEVSREITRVGGVRPPLLPDYNDQNYKLETGDSGLRTSLSNSSISSLLSNRQRLPFRTISLRQQFTSPIRSKTSSNPSIINPHRSASLRHPVTTAHLHSTDNNLNETNDTELLSAFGHRPMTSVSLSKQLKRNYIIHFDYNSVWNRHITPDFNEANHQFTKSSFHGSTPQRFQSALKPVRSSCITSLISANHDANVQTTRNNTKESIRSSHMNNGHGSSDFRGISKTVFV